MTAANELGDPAATSDAEMADRLAKALRSVIRPDASRSPHGVWAKAAAVLAEYDALRAARAGEG